MNECLAPSALRSYSDSGAGTPGQAVKQLARPVAQIRAQSRDVLERVGREEVARREAVALAVPAVQSGDESGVVGCAAACYTWQSVGIEAEPAW